MKRQHRKPSRTGLLLTEDDLARTIQDLVNWKVVDGKLHREYSFGSFPKAFAFIAGAVLISEAMNHPIEWYNKSRTVSVALQSPALGGISTIDVLLAKRLDELN